MLLLPLAVAAGEEMKYFTCLQNLIAVGHWIRTQEGRSGWSWHRHPLSAQHGEPRSRSIHQCWQKRISSLCFTVAVQIHFQQAFKLQSGMCTAKVDKCPFCFPCCRNKWLGRAVAPAGFHNLP